MLTEIDKTSDVVGFWSDAIGGGLDQLRHRDEPDVVGRHPYGADQTDAWLAGGLAPRTHGRDRAVEVHYLVTGHTGFKGSWLTLLLVSRGHSVSGLALNPAEGSLFTRAALADQLVHHFQVDIRDAEGTAAAVSAAAPEVVLHMAAQPLVRESYRRPRDTYETNALGTLNVLEAVAATPSVRALVIVTTDKVYRDNDQEVGYVETDALGGDDPYSASKAMADLLAQSWVRSFPGAPTAIARAGNVIGGGDVSRDRLLPDLIAAYAHGQTPRLRFPRAVRPWQHVLDCLNGYLTLADALLAGFGQGEWNFGPGRDSFIEVGQVATLVGELWGSDAHWELDRRKHPHETNLLALDTSKAQRELGWRNRLGSHSAVTWTVDWERRVRAGTDPLTVTLDQIASFAILLEQNVFS